MKVIHDFKMYSQTSMFLHWQLSFNKWVWQVPGVPPPLSPGVAMVPLRLITLSFCSWFTGLLYPVATDYKGVRSFVFGGIATFIKYVKIGPVCIEMLTLHRWVSCIWVHTCPGYMHVLWSQMTHCRSFYWIWVITKLHMRYSGTCLERPLKTQNLVNSDGTIFINNVYFTCVQRPSVWNERPDIQLLQRGFTVVRDMPFKTVHICFFWYLTLNPQMEQHKRSCHNDMITYSVTHVYLFTWKYTYLPQIKFLQKGLLVSYFIYYHLIMIWK